MLFIVGAGSFSWMTRQYRTSYFFIEIYWSGSFITLILSAELFKMSIVKLFLHKTTIWSCAHKQVLIIATQHFEQSDVWPFVCGDGLFSALGGCDEVSEDDEWIMNPSDICYTFETRAVLYCTTICRQVLFNYFTHSVEEFHLQIPSEGQIIFDCPQRPLEK